MLTRPAPTADLPPLSEIFAPVANHDVIGVAVSGGPDSLALMVLAARWAADTPGKKLIVYAVDHGLRAEAEAETGFVASTAEELGLEARVLRWAGDKPATGIQAAAREARYTLIGDAMRNDGATVLMTAHHLGDQAETVLMRLAHGSGLTGLGGIAQQAQVHGVTVCRPLLDIERATLAAVVARAGLQAIVDPSNENDDFERVRWRKALPELGVLGLDAHRLSVFARRMQRADAALGKLAEATFAQIARVDAFGVVRVGYAAFAALDDELQIRVLRRALILAGDGNKPHALQQAEALVPQLVAPEEFTQVTLAGAVLACGQNEICLYREVGRIGAGRMEIAPGAFCDWDDRFRVHNRSDKTIVVERADSLTREKIEDLRGESLAVPMAQVASAPVVRLADGRVLSIGTEVLESGIDVAFSRAEH